MMKDIALGVRASVVFRSLLQADPLMNAREIGNALMLEFPEISPAAALAVRRWLSPGKEYEISDEGMDAVIAHYLKEAGYIS